jgi:hypothetical protein
LGGQKLVAVTVTVAPGLHHVGSISWSQAISLHWPQDGPSLKSAVLSAAVRVP